MATLKYWTEEVKREDAIGKEYRGVLTMGRGVTCSEPLPSRHACHEWVKQELRKLGASACA
jgi:hypothetical protein